MPFRCVAFNCSNVPSKNNTNEKDNVCLHKWPTDKSQADAPKLWNELPPEIRNASTLPLFKTMLKTHLFRNF